MRNKVFLTLLIFIFLLTSGFGCRSQSQKVAEGLRPITLNYWRAWDGPDAFADIITNYNQLHPNIKINYRKFRYEEYEKELLDAFTEDRGPDIFSVHNTWVKKYQNKIEPLPETTTMVYPIVKGTLKKEIFSELRTNKSITVQDVKKNFVDVVYDDAVINIKDEETKASKEKIYGLPLFLDTLVMYYNKNLLNNAGIAEPPQYWNKKFQQDVKKLTKQNTKGQIIQSGVALGGSDNIERANDILSVLMMQNGTIMMNQEGTVLFNSIPPDYERARLNPGLQALIFYTDFANPAKEVYSWNSGLDNSLTMFMQNKLALFFGYSYHLPLIKAEAPKINFAVTKLPQIEGNQQSINFANYWLETVSRKILTDPENLKLGQSYAKQKFDAAWDFIQFMTKAEQVESYLNKTKRPTALRSLIDKQTEDPEVAVFVEQILTAKSWYRGKDPNAAEKIFSQMIDEAVTGQNKIEDVINLAARRIQQTIK